MNIHYFQRYHEKENVATANTMLLLSRLYSYSSDKFFRFLKTEYFSDSFNLEPTFRLQEKSVDSIPDVGIEEQEDDGEPFDEKMKRLTSELSEMFAKSHELENEIREKLGAIGYDI